LVFFGGTDSGNATGAVLSAISRLELRELQVDVVVGSTHPECAGIERICRALNARCHIQTPHMAQLMADADLAIGAGGTATWERCALGLPAMVFCLAENQRQLINDGSRAGLLYASDIDFTDVDSILLHLRALLANSGLRNLISRNCLSMVDGAGVSRVLRAMDGTAIAVRLAVQDDKDDLLAWRNDSAVRAVSRFTELISPEAHARWFESILSDPTRRLLIGSRAGQPVGVVRFDLSGDDAEVSIYLAPSNHGRGEGQALLLAAEHWLTTAHPSVRVIKAEVLGNNIPSHRLFLGNGYVVQATHYIKRIQA
jgi:RimJ/RimL family protein N-acetyltransferase